MNKILFILQLICFPYICFAQKTASVNGQIIDENNYQPLGGVSVICSKLRMMTATDSNGNFYLPSIPYGKYELVIAYRKLKERIKIAAEDTLIDLGVLPIRTNNEAPVTYEQTDGESITSDGQSEESHNSPISGILNASRDVYLSAAAFNLGALRYQIRGYKRDQQEVYMNGLLLNDAETGVAFWSQWGGLNDAFRNQYTTFALAPADAGTGGLAGSTAIDATAINQRKQLRVTYSLSNRSYRHRTMFTYSTGLLPSGWAFSVSASARRANEGYIPGTFFKGYSWYGGISKKINKKHYVHLMTFGSPTAKGKAMPATKEAMDIAGDHYYNANWGWLNGEKRNTRINESFQPTALFTYEYKPDNTTQFVFSALYQQGYTSNSTMDWYNAQDPRPDYYRKLPGYYLYNAAGVDSFTARRVLQELLEDQDKMQVDWERIYQANSMNSDSVNGIIGNRSVYIIGEDRDDSRKLSLSANYQKTSGDHFIFYLGEFLTIQHAESYRTLQDLLGGDFYVNLNQFAEQSYPGNILFNQNDLNNPNGIIRTGDKYNYYYRSRFTKIYAWGQIQASFNNIDAFIAARAALDIFSREGIFRNGLFPERSAGRSLPNNFFNYLTKAGITLKINGRNYLLVNGLIATAAPAFDNTYISPRTRNDIINNPSVEHIYSFEAGYLLRSPRITGRLTGYMSDIRNTTEIRRFYHEDYRTFVNFVMQPVDIRYTGAEFAFRVKLSPSFTGSIIASWKQVFYTNRPDISIYRDNDTSSKAGNSIAYIQNFKVAAGPQSAYVLNLNYNSPKFWYANISCNYSDRNYVDINPSRRTAEALDLVVPGSKTWTSILEQEKLPAAFTLDIFAGKSFMLGKAMKRLPYGTLLYINLGINNVLNNRNIITGGFEQLRYDYTNRNPERFPSKYFYAQGINYFLNMSIKF